MITQNNLTWALTGPDPVDPRHPVVVVSTNDPRFPLLYQVFDAQQVEIPIANKDLHDRYMEALTLAQREVDAGTVQNVSAPVKPRMLVMDDLGNRTEIDFVPPLPDLVPAAKPTPNVPGMINPATRPADPNVVLSMHTSLLMGIKTDIAAIKTKLGI